MKINKMITLDYDIVEKLAYIENASSLINNMLKDYFSMNSTKKINKLTEKELVLSNFKQKMHEIRIEIKVLKALTELNIDENSRKWLEKRPEVGRMEIIEYKKSHNIDVSSDNFIKAHELLKKYGFIHKED